MIHKRTKNLLSGSSDLSALSRLAGLSCLLGLAGLSGLLGSLLLVLLRLAGLSGLLGSLGLSSSFGVRDGSDLELLLDFLGDNLFKSHFRSCLVCLAGQLKLWPFVV